MSSEVFLHGVRSSKESLTALQAATQALEKANNSASVLYMEIGSYVMATLTAGGTTQPNSLVAGSQLNISGTITKASTNKRDFNFNHIKTNLTLPGTWRCMGYITNTGANISCQSATLWVRVL